MTRAIPAFRLLVCLTANIVLVEPLDSQKRLLLTGTENLQQQYHSLQLEIQEMKTKYGQQESTVTQLEATIRDLNNKVQAQENKTQRQESKLQGQESTIQGNGNTIRSLENTIRSQGNKSQNQENKIQVQETNLQVQERTIQSLENTIRNLENKSQSQESTIQSLGNTIHSQGTTIQNQEITIHQLSDQMSKMAKDEWPVWPLYSRVTSTNNLYRCVTSTDHLTESGSVYIRWGKETCPGNATLVYSGYTAGTHSYVAKGSSASSVCLPRDPIWSSNEPPHNGNEAKLYGTEYQFNIASQQVYDNDVPCAVCMSQSRSEVLMIPGRNRCYDGWNEEYNGYLIGPYHDYGSEDILCIDGHPDVIFGGAADLNGHMIYLVMTHCGPLQCPPYEENKVVTCVVCSK